MVSLLIFVLIIGPTCTLLHEVGHGIGAIATSKANVHIYLGSRGENNKENFKIGRLHFHIQWSFAGFAHWGKGLTRKQRVAALAGGPIMSLLLVFLFSFLASSLSQNEIRALMNGAATYSLIQFVMTVIPITYPRWMGGYSGFPSDGLQLLRLFKTRHEQQE